jgi:hypothetical protein
LADWRKKSAERPTTGLPTPQNDETGFLPLFGLFFARITLRIGILDNYGEQLWAENEFFSDFWVAQRVKWPQTEAKSRKPDPGNPVLAPEPESYICTRIFLYALPLKCTFLTWNPENPVF